MIHYLSHYFHLSPYKTNEAIAGYDMAIVVLQDPLVFDPYRQPLVPCGGLTGLSNVNNLDIWSLGMGLIQSGDEDNDILPTPADFLMASKKNSGSTQQLPSFQERGILVKLIMIVDFCPIRMLQNSNYNQKAVVVIYCSYF